MYTHGLGFPDLFDGLGASIKVTEPIAIWLQGDRLPWPLGQRFAAGYLICMYPRECSRIGRELLRWAAIAFAGPKHSGSRLIANAHDCGA